MLSFGSLPSMGLFDLKVQFQHQMHKMSLEQNISVKIFPVSYVFLSVPLKLQILLQFLA